MQRYYDYVSDQQGNAISGAQIAVYISGTTNLATIYSATGSRTAPAAKANPFTTDANGAFSFAAGDGNYDIQISGGSIPTTTKTNIILYDDLNTSPSPALGTVTSVSLALPAIFTVSGSPVTGAGTLTGTLASQNQNLVFAAPNGSAGTPTFRAIVAADLPASGVAAASYGSTSAIPVVTFDAYGRATAASTASIAAPFAGITGKPTTLAGYGITDGASINVANAWTKGQNVQVSSQTPAGGGTVTPDVTATNVYYIQMPAGNITLANPINTTSGASGVAATLTIVIKQDAVGGRTISYGAKFKFPGGVTYQPDATSSAISSIYCQYEPNNDIWLVTSASKFA